jgi:hypothetical protein
MNKTDQLIFIAIIFVFCAIIYSYTHLEQKVVYPCDIAEISPDIPLQVKQECRKLRNGN